MVILYLVRVELHHSPHQPPVRCDHFQLGIHYANSAMVLHYLVRGNPSPSPTSTSSKGGYVGTVYQRGTDCNLCLKLAILQASGLKNNCSLREASANRPGNDIELRKDLICNMTTLWTTGTGTILTWRCSWPPF